MIPAVTRPASSGALRALLLAALCVGPACQDDPASLWVRLQADPARQSEGDVAREISQLRLVVDLPVPGQEISGLPAGAGSGDLQYLDVEGDGAREPVYTLPWPATDRLPVLEITSHRNAGLPVLLRVEGYDAGGQLVAIGGLATAVLGGADETAVPFNLLPSRLPPRVVATQPEGGQVLPSLGDFTVTFSRKLQLDTLSPATVYLGCTAGDGTRTEWHPTVVFVTEETFENPSLTRHRVRGVLQSNGAGDTTCAITIPAGLLADDGTPFDQDATRPGADGFVGEPFTIQAPTNYVNNGCSLPVNDPDHVDCAAFSLVCDPGAGVCVTTAGCGGCAAGSLCDPGLERCVEDCRGFGACALLSQACLDTGLCS
jgi:hypothetical protein